MTFAEDVWLRGKAAQSSMLQLLAYNTAFAGTATLQAWKLGLTAPSGFWQAMGRVSGANGALTEKAEAVVIDLPVKKKAATPRKAKAVKQAPATPKAAQAIALKTAAKPAKPAEVATPTPLKSDPVKTTTAKTTTAKSTAAKTTQVKKAATKAEVTKLAKPKAAAAPKAVSKPKSKATAAKAKAKAAPTSKPIDLGPSPHLLDAPRGGKADDLTSLTGIGTKLATSLNEFGIYHFDQIATLDEGGVDWLNEQQPGFKMLAARYKVIDQAKARAPA